MSFLNIRIPEEISFIAEGGPNFSTNISTSSGGIEIRNKKYLRPVMQYKINYQKLNLSMMQNLLTFFYLVKGRAYSFRFKDFFDHKVEINNSSNNLNIKKNFFLVMDDVDFLQNKWDFCLQLCKNYSLRKKESHEDEKDCQISTYNDFFYQRLISKPIKKTLKVFYDERKLIGGVDFELDEDKGFFYCKQINLDKLNLSFEFDVCVRFAKDSLNLTHTNPGIFDVSDIELLEVFE